MLPAKHEAQEPQQDGGRRLGGPPAIQESWDFSESAELLSWPKSGHRLGDLQCKDDGEAGL